MRAVRFDRYGGVEVLEVRDVADPLAGPGGVLVTVRAAGVNPGEMAIRQGHLHERFPASFPSGEGTDFAGVVRAWGRRHAFAGATRCSAGPSGERATRSCVVVPAQQLTAKPASVSWEVAGSLFVAGMAAWACVDSVAPSRARRSSSRAAAGGVGSIAVQLARRTGARVIGLAGERNHEWLRATAS